MTNLPFILRLIPCVGLWLVLFAPIKTKALDTNAAAGFELAKSTVRDAMLSVNLTGWEG